MHIDLAHAAVSAVLIFATLTGLSALGVREGAPGRVWKVLAAIFAVMFVFNLLWPAS